jgi:CBS domain-containing protein
MEGAFMDVKHICSDELIFINKDQNILDGLKLMEKHKISRLPVNNDKKELVGIATEKGIAIKLSSLKYENLPPSHFHISTIMTKDVISIQANENIVGAAKILIKNNIGGLPVYSSDDLIGIVTKSDLIDICKGKAYQKIYVKDYMIKNLISVPQDSRLIHARRMVLEHNVGRVLIKNENDLVGILTFKDILDAFISFKEKVPETHQNAQIKNLLVEDVMSSNLEKINSNATIAEVAEKMLSLGFNGLPVVDDGDNLIGIITKTDLLTIIIDLES